MPNSESDSVRMTRDKKSIKTIPVLNPTDQINQVNRTNVSQLKKNNLPFDLSSACIVGRISVTEKENIAGGESHFPWTKLYLLGNLVL
jgi:hypothetical protein